ncbi:MAG: Low-specificity L-threonine aldolase, partial [uncultured Thermomicrobiales bacterium]
DRGGGGADGGRGRGDDDPGGDAFGRVGGGLRTGGRGGAGRLRL